MQVINAELAGPVPVFIYANKNGAHFPYHHGYRGDGTIPQDATAGAKAESIRTYINNLRWNVDHALADFLDNADLSETLVLYTSDHGQNFDPDRLTHCSVENPDPREALVPMMAMTGDAALKARLSDAAGKSFNRTSHFELVASVIDIMGYRHGGIAEAHGHSLFAGPPAADAGFTTGDIFGLFRSQVRWNAIDLSADYLENEARNLAPSTTPVNVSAANELRPSYR
jgi:lipid A ethanolaminephosphotransferase